MKDCRKVVWKKKVALQLEKVPPQIEKKFYAWVSLVQLVGLREVRKTSGFHDEPLKGDRAGQRSIRLNRAYRAIYVERLEGILELVEVIEVNKHDY